MESARKDATRRAGIVLISEETITILAYRVENGYHLRRMADSGKSWAERATEELRAAGHRAGSARREVIRFLDTQSCCLAAQEIHDELRTGGRAIGLASVYRVLETLTEKGLLQRLEFGDGVARFEPVRDDHSHHHHLVCDECGKVETFTDDRLEKAIRQVESRSGYAVAAHDVVLRGACTACR
jgi:Fur family ferric uptake transcriptional regulator